MAHGSVPVRLWRLCPCVSVTHSVSLTQSHSQTQSEIIRPKAKQSVSASTVGYYIIKSTNYLFSHDDAERTAALQFRITVPGTGYYLYQPSLALVYRRYTGGVPVHFIIARLSVKVQKLRT